MVARVTFPHTTLISALFIVTACRPSTVFEDHEWVLSESPTTTVTLTWTTTEPTISAVEFGLDQTFSASAPSESDGYATAHELTLFGLKAGYDYDFQFTAETESGVAHTSEPDVFTTLAPPSDLPELTVEVHDPEAAREGFLVGSIMSIPSAAVIIDTDGDYRWWHMDGRTLTIPRAYLSASGDSLVYMATGNYDEIPVQELVRAPLDGSTIENIPIIDGHHDFVELPDGTLTYLETDTQVKEEGFVIGDKLVEIAPDGTATDVWTAWDHFEYDPDMQTIAGSGWTHANAIDYDAERDVYYLSVRNFETIIEIDRSDFSVDWMLGGERTSDFTLVGDGESFSHQHQFHMVWDEARIMVMDNFYVANEASRVVEYAVDFENYEYEEIWSFEPEPAIFVYGLGGISEIPGGNRNITWSSAGQMDQVNDTGESVWQLNGSIGAGFGYATWFDELDFIVE